MREILDLAWRYLAYHRFKTLVLVAAVTVIVYLPVGLDILVSRSAEHLRARAQATPLLIGAKGSPLELALHTLYFRTETPPEMRYAEATRVIESGLARGIPLYTRFRAQDLPIVGTSLDYFDFRGLVIEAGRPMAVLGECVLGAEAAAKSGARPGDHVISSPEGLFDLAGVYPLKMKVVGMLSPSGTADDRAVFVDVKTAWVIDGLAHGHEDLSRPQASLGVLKIEGDTIVANASVRQYSEITPENRESFHFHGDPATFPITAVIVEPHDEKSATLLRGRYLAEDELVQIVEPVRVIDDLLNTVVTVQNYVTAAVIVVGASTLATMALVFLLSIQLRRREIETMVKIGAPRSRVVAIVAAEILSVLLAGGVLAGILSALTIQFGAMALRLFVLG